ncbi:MAG: peptide chain release factor 1 [Candidatus Kerfeldbacteria bacterium]
MDTSLFQAIRQNYSKLEAALQSPDVSSDPKKLQEVSIEYNDLKEKVETIDKVESIMKAIDEAKQTIASGEDPELSAIAKDELTTLEQQRETLEQDLQLLLLPKDPRDSKSIIVEIRAGAGGDEAGLFAANLFRAYSRYAEVKGWKTNLISTNRTGIGGYKEVIFEIQGAGAFSDFKYESGVHRVQRIPDTEKAGRVHTSTVTVAVMPEVEEVELDIPDAELRIDVFRSGGHGGQSVNTTDSAVRITHLPTNIVVTCQDEKSQHKNKAKAMKILRARILDKMEEEERQKRGDERRMQVGTGDRSEKIRTYNYPQDRITDHRIKENWSDLQGKMDGDLGHIIEALREADKAKRLESLQA